MGYFHLLSHTQYYCIPKSKIATMCHRTVIYKYFILTHLDVLVCVITGIEISYNYIKENNKVTQDNS